MENKVDFLPYKKEIISNTEDIYIIYSNWKRWVLKDFNAKYFPAFEYIDDMPILINGWKIILEK